MLDGLGTAEMWHVFLSNRPGAVRPGTLGTVVPGFEIQLVGDDGREVAPGEVGRMRVKGGSRAHAYWQHPCATREAFCGDWYLSGDMLTKDADGYFSYQGRTDDLLKVSGKWLSPNDVEECLVEHPYVREAAVVGVVTKDGLTKPEAFVILTSDTDPETAGPALQDHVKRRLDPYKYPRKVHIVQELPRTHLGKVDRGALKRTARQPKANKP